MDIFDFIRMLGGLSLFLFGMNIMGQALERRAGGSLRLLLEKMTKNKFTGLLTGIGITAVIQSSSAATVMVVGFVNSGLMSLSQAINVIMGANIGTTVTAWILSLAGIQSSNPFIELLSPAYFTPVVALIGIILFMVSKSDRKKDDGTILLGFAVLMFGMESMTGSVSGLAAIPWFRNLFLLFQNPFLGMAAGAVLTALIQSSSASIGILQALAITGDVTYSSAIPIIMGQNIGTCLTAMLSGMGANINAKRTALVHLSFNVLGTVFYLTLFVILKTLIPMPFLNESASLFGIAVVHSAFNILCTLLMLPLSSVLERLVIFLVPDGNKDEERVELDERLFATPPIALKQCEVTAIKMADIAFDSLKESLKLMDSFDMQTFSKIERDEERSDHYEDILGTYLIKLSALKISREDSEEAAKLLKVIGDFERISDHAYSIAKSSRELNEKRLSFSDEGKRELGVLSMAVNEILSLTLASFKSNDKEIAKKVEPLEETIDLLKEKIRTHHILRLQQNICSAESGFVLSDILTDLERVSDHCSNIAGCIIDVFDGNLNLHESLRKLKKGNKSFDSSYSKYIEKYKLT